MFKIIIFIILGVVILLLIRKLVRTFTKNTNIQYILYLLLIFALILFIFFYRENTLQNTEGTYEPPKFNGDKVIPGKVVDE